MRICDACDGLCVFYRNEIEFIDSKEEPGGWLRGSENLAGIAVADVRPLYNLQVDLLPDLILELLTPVLQLSTHSPIAG